MQIALKETSETEYWILLLQKTGYMDKNRFEIKEMCQNLKHMLIATLNTCKKKMKDEK